MLEGKHVAAATKPYVAAVTKPHDTHQVYAAKLLNLLRSSLEVRVPISKYIKGNGTQ
jgi:hypothetical protein